MVEQSETWQLKWSCDLQQFGPNLARWVVWEAQSFQSADHNKLDHLYDCSDHITQIALVANKYPILFYLKGGSLELIALR